MTIYNYFHRYVKLTINLLFMTLCVNLRASTLTASFVQIQAVNDTFTHILLNTEAFLLLSFRKNFRSGPSSGTCVDSGACTANVRANCGVRAAIGNQSVPTRSAFFARPRSLRAAYYRPVVDRQVC